MANGNATPNSTAEDLLELVDKRGLGEESLEMARDLLRRESANVVAANVLGRSLVALGAIEEARDHWHAVIESQPGNSIAQKQLKSLEGHLKYGARNPRTGKVQQQAPPPEEIVEPVLRGPGRDACILHLATAIRLIEKHGPNRIAVTYRFSDKRFRIAGGKGSVVAPLSGLLCTYLHGPALDDDLIATMESLGGRITYDQVFVSFPESVEWGVPFEKVDRVAERLVAPMREHILRSLEAGPPPAGHLHLPTLRDYVLGEADRLS